MEACTQALCVQGDNTKVLRTALRNDSFERWCNLKYQGYGAIHFKNHVASNDFVYNKNNLSSSEWVAAIKLSVNYANLNGVPGTDSPTNLCRKCGRETETIQHVIGSCPSNNTSIIARHHMVKHFIIELLRAIGYLCFEEVYGVDTDGRSRFSDIVAFDPRSKKAIIVDPTIRYESNDPIQDETIDIEKKQIYEKCIPFYSEKYLQSYGVRNWSVYGLWFGSRGCIGKSVLKFFKDFKLDVSKLKDISELTLIRTISIINSHIYS